MRAHYETTEQKIRVLRSHFSRADPLDSGCCSVQLFQKLLRVSEIALTQGEMSTVLSQHARDGQFAWREFLLGRRDAQSVLLKAGARGLGVFSAEQKQSWNNEREVRTPRAITAAPSPRTPRAAMDVQKPYGKVGVDSAWPPWVERVTKPARAASMR
jgi:hypothetical protein